MKVQYAPVLDMQAKSLDAVYDRPVAFKLF